MFYNSEFPYKSQVPWSTKTSKTNKTLSIKEKEKRQEKTKRTDIHKHVRYAHTYIPRTVTLNNACDDSYLSWRDT